jgi:hypothetical protein
MGFCSLQHIPASKVHLSRVCPPATFRLQGLVTLLAACSLRGLAGFVSHRQRSWDSPFGGFASHKVSDLLPAGTTHIPSGPSGIPAAEAPGRPERPRFLGLFPCREPLATTRGFSPLAAGSSLGFRPSRVFPRIPWPGFRPTSSRALRKREGYTPSYPPAPQSVDQYSLGLFWPSCRSAKADQATLLGFLHRLIPVHSSVPPAGLWIRLALGQASLLTRQRS